MKKWLRIFLVAILLIPILLLIFRKDNVLSRDEAIALCAVPASKYYTWNDLEIHYTEQGQGDTAILMIHGFGGSHKNFSVLADLLEEDYRIVCVDLPAFGLSEVPDLNMKEEAMFPLYQDFIRNALVSLDIKYYHLMGNSMGGWVAWDLASDNDSTLLSLTLLNSAGFGMEKVKETATGWMTGPFGKFVFKKGVPLRMSQSNAERCFSDDSKIAPEKVKESYYMLNKEGTFPWMLKMAASSVLPDTALLRQIECPTLILWGEEDEVVAVKHADHFADFLQNDEKIIYEKCGHTPQMEHPDLVAQDWRLFVAKKLGQ